MHSSSLLRQVPWSVDKCTFISDFRTLPLSSYDVIVSMDWLQSYSPMQIHCMRNGWSFHTKADQLCCKACKLKLLLVCIFRCVRLLQVPPQIQSLLDQYSALFAEPTTLPPSRACNQSIPLIVGSQPTFVCPYRYPPGLKDEIERQVTDMLSQGLIQLTSSSFYSPVLLVKKTDSTYRFCVDSGI